MGGGVKQAGTRMIFKQPTAIQWFGKLCGSLSQGGELIGDFSSACREREPLAQEGPEGVTRPTGTAALKALTQSSLAA